MNNFNFSKFIINTNIVEFDYNSFFNDFVNRYNQASNSDSREFAINQALNKLSEHKHFLKRFEHDFIERYPKNISLFTKVSQELNGNITLIDELNAFFHQNYPGIFYDVIQDTNFFNKDTELDTETMFLVMKNQKLSFDEKTVLRFLKSPLTMYHYNPLKEYFDNLEKWDGTDHVKRLVDLFDIKENITGINRREFMEKQLTKYFVRMLFQLFGKGMKNINKLSLLLLSPKGSGKTTFVKTKFFPDELRRYMVETFTFDRKDQNNKKTLCSQFIVFIDEFNGFANQKHNVSYKSINDFKLFSGNDSFDIIQKGRKESRKRIGSFIFCANPDTYHGIHEDSLMHRFLHLDFNNGAANRLPFDKWNNEDTTKMWAQIYHLYKDNFPAQLTMAEEHTLNIINETYRTKATDLDSALSTYIKIGTVKNGKNYTASEVVEILRSSDKITEEVKVTLNEYAIGRKLKNLLNLSTIRDTSKSSGQAYRLIIDL